MLLAIRVSLMTGLWGRLAWFVVTTLAAFALVYIGFIRTVHCGPHNAKEGIVYVVSGLPACAVEEEFLHHRFLTSAYMIETAMQATPIPPKRAISFSETSM
jgi:hypothetical protein